MLFSLTELAPIPSPTSASGAIGVNPYSQVGGILFRGGVRKSGRAVTTDAVVLLLWAVRGILGASPREASAQ